jgi:hypothetical protein
MLNVTHLVDCERFIIINDPNFTSICEFNNLAVFHVDDVMDRQ